MMRASRSKLGALVFALAMFCGCVTAGSAFAQPELSPWWGIRSAARPTVLPEGGEGQIVVTAENLGDAATSGPVTIKDVLPEGLEARSVKAVAGGPGLFERGKVSCVKSTLTCTLEGTHQVVNEKEELETVPKSLPPYETIEVRIVVRAEGAVSGELNTATVSGGGAASAKTVSSPIQVGGPGRFGIEDFSLIPEEPGGAIDTQAGSHPFQLTSVIALNTQSNDKEGIPRTFALPKDIGAELPVGMFGNPTPFAQCTDEQFGDQITVQDQPINECPASAAVGVATISFNQPALGLGLVTDVVPIFNMVPQAGEPARFGFKAAGIVAAFLDTSVGTGGSYAVSVGSFDISQIQWLWSVHLTFWGVPGDPRHDAQRGWDCLQHLGGPGACPATKPTSPPPFLVMPTSCEAPFQSTLHADSWGSSEKPAETAEPVTYRLPEEVDGCNHLPFAPSISVSPDVSDGSSPSGLTVGVHVPQQAALNAEGLAESTLKDTTVTLPEGVTLNPAGADGLEACSEAQIGFTGIEPGGVERDLFTAGLPAPFCPDAAKVGTVTIRTPLLAHALEGAVYLAQQEANPFGSLIAMYLVARDPVSGTLIKLAGEVRTDPNTGRIVSTFKNTPELPFEDLELHFFGGQRAPLATPARCDTYTTGAVFAPWSGNESATPSSSFDVTSGPDGSPCPGASLPFAPSLTAGTTSIQAGGLSPFTMTMSREDGQQSLQAISLHMPPGLSGLLTGVELCQEPQASQGLCGPNSLIGETIVSVGLGSEPFSVKGGRVYLTGPYEGAPFGLSIVNPAKAGPFDLEKNTPCDCVVVRAKIEVDPITAQLTVTSDNTGPFKIPTILDGIPLQIQHVNVTVNRPAFTFNPTNCNPMSITGSLSSTQGATSSLAVPFQATNCAVLGFKPGFSVSTAGKTSRANGASLHVKLTYPKAPFGSQANIAKVKVDLPKQLPSRLTTLQKACTSAQFEANPAGCPSASIVGHAKAITPLIPVPLEGPAYFVSHGGAKFPELIVVLQGYNVTIDLHGETFINKEGITSSTFATVPDAPVGSFELTLPQGKYSALAANGNLCKTKLKMPTAFTAQNGVTIKQSTTISISGCPKKKAVTHKKKAKKAARQHGRGHRP
jgi:hypothetical protein